MFYDSPSEDKLTSDASIIVFVFFFFCNKYDDVSCTRSRRFCACVQRGNGAFDNLDSKSIFDNFGEK